MTDLATTSDHVTGGLAIRTMDDLARLGTMLAKSGYFTDAKDAAQAGAKVLAGLEMGIGAFAAMSGINIIKGKPSVGAGLMAAAVKRHPKYDYRVRSHSDAGCEIEFFEGDESLGVSTFNADDAKLAGLLGNDNYKRNPRNMFFARALSNGVRWYCPDVFDVSTYTPEELGADTDEDGDIVDAPSRPATQAQPEAEPEPPTVDEVAEDEFPPEPPEAVFADEERAAEQAAGITSAQLRKLAVTMKEVGIGSDRAYAHAFITWAIGRPVESSTNLTKVEAHRLLDWSDEDWQGRMDEFRTTSEFAEIPA